MAVADQGWYPPNRKLLEHPSLIKDIHNGSSPDGDPTPTGSASLSSALSNSEMSLNVYEEEYMAVTVLNCMVTDRR